MEKIKKKILMSSLIHDDYTKFIETFNHFKLVLDESFFDYELLKVALDRKLKTITNFLISKGCRVRNPNKINLEETPLHLAMKLEDDSIISTILNKDASIIYDKNLRGETALHAAFKVEYNSAVIAVLNYISNCNLIFNPDNKDDVLHFHIACIKKHVSSINLYLSFGFDVDSYLSIDSATFSGLTPLHYLVSKKHYGNLFKILLDHSDLSIKNGNGLTPLQSIYYNELSFHKIMTQVFKDGNDSKFINAVDESGVSHFHLCCSTDYSDFVQIFINNGVDVNSSISFNCSHNAGFTPLHFAVKYARLEVVEVLLKNGADCNRSDKKGETPLHLACNKDFESDETIIQIIEILLNYSACPVAVDKLGSTPIHIVFNNIANFNEEANILDKLISKVPLKINLTDEGGLSLFHIVCTRNEPDQVNYFLNSGVAIDSCVSTGIFCGYTALHLAVFCNQKAVVEVLLKRNASVNVKTREFDTPLHLACEFTDLKFCDVYYEYENAISNDKPINLDWISNRTKQLDIIKLLLLYGADIEAVNNIDFTPLFACLFHADATFYPKFFGNNVINEINIRLIEITNIFLSNKPNINCTNYEQSSVFHVISVSHLPRITDELMECFISAGADINAVDEYGYTALHYAALWSKKELVQTFLKHKANINVKGEKSETPLQMAISIYKDYSVTNEDIKLRKSNQICITILLEHNSEVNIRTEDGRTLLHEAVSLSSTFLTEKLLYYGADINMEDLLGNSVVCSLLKSGEVNSRINVLCVIFIHVQKLLALGLYINDKVQKFCIHLHQYCKTMVSEIDYNSILDNALDDCINELNSMKLKKIDNYTSLYNVLLKDPHELSKHIRNKILIDIFERENIDEKFPLYSYLLTLKYKKSLLRSNVLKCAKASLIYVTNSNLPDPCYDSILRYLTNEEIVNLKASVGVKDRCKTKLNDDSNETGPTIKLQKKE